MVHRPDLPPQPDLANGHGLRVNGLVAEARYNRQPHPHIHGWLVEANAPYDIDENVLARQVVAAALFEHRDNNREPLGVDAGGNPLRITKTRARDEGLNLDQEWPRALYATDDGRTRHTFSALGQQNFGGIGDLNQPLVPHLKNPDLVGRTKAIFGGSQDAEVVVPLAL